ncbi:hypothetical protein T459_13608 [Capsicum annuum]|uniref:Uncharacterized protein n=1 Tax=Capsicum annuum TaxID=4072 RepID=A0A2G2ZF05_CAPAN|nr:hypothetical protein T459_13608 [Capsicum annuum]
MEGPLSVVDWCKGRSQSDDGGISGDGFSAESTDSASECRDSSSTISLLSLDICLSESEHLLGSRLRPTLAVAVPATHLILKNISAELHALSLKKQKVNEEESDSDSDSDDGGSSKFGELEPLWDEVLKLPSEGITRYDRDNVDLTLKIIRDRFHSVPYTPCGTIELMEGYAAQALEQYNKENDTTYEVDQILRRSIYSIHYITLTVKNGVEEYFQVKAVQRLGIPIVRPKEILYLHSLHWLILGAQTGEMARTDHFFPIYAGNTHGSMGGLGARLAGPFGWSNGMISGQIGVL